MILSAALASCACAWAIPAKPQVLTLAQPDGTQIALTMAGDEYFHYFLTDDMQMVVRHADGSFRFATVDAEGRIAPSPVLAANIKDRTEAQAQFVNTLSRSELTKAIKTTKRLSPLYATQLAAVTAEMQEQAAETQPSRAPQRVEGSMSYGLGRTPGSNFPLEGDVRGLCVLVEYSDKAFMRSDEDTYDYFEAMLNEPGFSEEKGTGSAWDFFNDASKGKFNPTFDVIGPVTLPHNRSYYGANNSYTGNDKNAVQMVTDALDILVAQGVDFSPYDNDGNHVIDNVFVFYAGEGEAQSGVAEAIWPHQYKLSYMYGSSGYSLGNGYYADSYACSSECNDANGRNLDGIGTFVHEFSHVMGLPDLYNTDDAYAGYTPVEYSVLDVGPYNNNSRTPPTYSTFERNAMKWIELEDLTEDTEFCLDNLQTSNHGYILPSSSRYDFFLFENRQKEGWDAYIPYHGMLVWHINYSQFVWTRNQVNNDPQHQYVDIVEASGRTSSTNSFVKRSYPYPGYNKVTELASDRIKTWSGDDLGFNFTNITEKDGQITAIINGRNGIGSIMADGAGKLAVNVDGRTVSVATSDASRIVIADAMGRIVSRGQAVAVLAPGLYIVSTPEGTAKLAVR